MPKFDLTKYVSVIQFSRKRLLQTAVIGFFVGALTWLVSLWLQTGVIEPVFCRSTDSFSACANGGNISIIASLIILNTLGLLALVRLDVYRPLLVVIAALATLASAHSWLGGFSWYEASLWYGLLFAVAYTLYSWIARMTSFASAAITMLIVIVMLRVFMTL